MSKSNALTPKILLWDLETAPNISYTWPGKYEVDVIDFVRPWYALTFAYKWLGDRKVGGYSLPMFKGYKQDKANDRALMQKLWSLMNEADIVVGHNAAAFDNKSAFARFLYHNFQPPAPFKTVDTLLIARNGFKFNSNKLDDLGQHFGFGHKMIHTGFDMWRGCFERDERRSWKLMLEYNKRDVELLEKVYLRLRPWMKNHPNYNLIAGTTDHCTNCGKPSLIVRGYYNTSGGRRQRLQCTDCGHYCNRPANQKKPNQIARQI